MESYEMTTDELQANAATQVVEAENKAIDEVLTEQRKNKEDPHAYTVKSSMLPLTNARLAYEGFFSAYIRRPHLWDQATKLPWLAAFPEPSNWHTKRAKLDANGNCQYAWTDTDDYFGAVDNQAPVTMKPARLPDGKTIIIPNTVGILKHSDKVHAARIFVNYLTSAKIELAMAHSSSRQIPVGPVDEKLPQEVAELQKYLDQGADLKQTFSERTSLLNWIKKEHQLK